jgi:hypothetical protein
MLLQVNITLASSLVNWMLADCGLDGITLSNEILLWLPESSHLCVILHCHDEATFLPDSCSWPCYWMRKKHGALFSGKPHIIYLKILLEIFTLIVHA